MSWCALQCDSKKVFCSRPAAKKAKKGKKVAPVEKELTTVLWRSFERLLRGFSKQIQAVFAVFSWEHQRFGLELA